MLPKTRLGKRSPLGALVSSGGPAVEIQTNMQKCENGITAVGSQVISRARGHPGLKVHFQCPESGLPGMADHLDLTPNGISGCFPSHSSSPTAAPVSGGRSVSTCIDVPSSGRKPGDVDMDELMAAMILSSLSCSPLLHSPTYPEAPGGELSDSSSSGYWSVGHANGSPAPSPPRPVTPPDEGLSMELEQEPLDEPAPRKRRNSLKVAYRCLWPSCEKVLTSVVGIKRHIRITHLCHDGEHERCSRSEEDFYYTEVTQHQPPTDHPSCGSPLSNSPAPPPSPPSPPPYSALSCSAPSCSSGSFWQVQSEHSYQALPPSHVVTAAATFSASCQWTSPTSTSNSQQLPPPPPPPPPSPQSLPIRVRSVSVGEQWLQHHSARRIRGEAKKCRKVYGIEHRDQWCTACRWKKACQRFLD